MHIVYSVQYIMSYHNEYSIWTPFTAYIFTYENVIVFHDFYVLLLHFRVFDVIVSLSLFVHHFSLYLYYY
jgi:hypothetical protein